MSLRSGQAHMLSYSARHDTRSLGTVTAPAETFELPVLVDWGSHDLETALVKSHEQAQRCQDCHGRMIVMMEDKDDGDDDELELRQSKRRLDPMAFVISTRRLPDHRPRCSCCFPEHCRDQRHQSGEIAVTRTSTISPLQLD
ncbi:hypothetical protein MN608_08548 [Microdochium nivale]|nr:hypothetical protein MN608_08548 [Microdochium nivale]